MLSCSRPYVEQYRRYSLISVMFILLPVQGLVVLAILDTICHSVANQMYSREVSEQIWGMNMMSMGIGGIFGAMFGRFDPTSIIVLVVYI